MSKKHTPTKATHLSTALVAALIAPSVLACVAPAQEPSAPLYEPPTWAEDKSGLKDYWEMAGLNMDTLPADFDFCSRIGADAAPQIVAFRRSADDEVEAVMAACEGGKPRLLAVLMGVGADDPASPGTLVVAGDIAAKPLLGAEPDTIVWDTFTQWAVDFVETDATCDPAALRVSATRAYSLQALDEGSNTEPLLRGAITSTLVGTRTVASCD